MRWLPLLALLPSIALAQGPRIVSGSGTYATGPRILGEPAFAFELDALEQDEVTRPGWPVTTTRASTRMCFTGTAWQTVPENTPCIGRYGLAAFGPGTNYIANSTAPVLTLSGGATVATVTEGGLTFQRITMPAGSKAEIAPAAGPVSGDAVVATVEVKGSGAFLLSPETSTTGARAVTLGAAWARESFGRTSTTDPRVVMQATSASVVDLGQAQLERGTITPGPRHDCGASACSWAADVHTVSTAGWPVAAGRFDFEFIGDVPTAPSVGTILDTRSPTTGLTGMVLFFSSAGWRLQFANATTSHTALVGPSHAPAPAYRGTIEWDAAGAKITVNGVTTTHPGAQVMNAHHAVAAIGSNRVGANPANGFIRLLRVSQ